MFTGGANNGYFGTFCGARFNNYPLNMPISGNHLISIHANSSEYEVLLDNISKGIQEGNYYNPGTLFEIATNDKAFGGDISCLIVYPFFIDKTSASHAQNISAFNNLYPALSLS
jgi:hypothetical protein